MPFDTITMVSRARAEQIIEEYQPEGMFITLGETGYVAIDNRTNDAWTEEFMTLAEACRWVQGSYVKGEEYDEEDEDEEEMGDDQAERFRQCIQDGISNTIERMHDTIKQQEEYIAKARPAVYKATPEKPYIREFMKGTPMHEYRECCPSCHSIIDYEYLGNKYCSNCGKAWDWSK